jgi:hypothetical protein
MHVTTVICESGRPQTTANAAAVVARIGLMPKKALVRSGTALDACANGVDTRIRCTGYARWMVRLVCAITLAGTVSQAVELKQEALKSWEEYVQAADLQMRGRLGAGGVFLWVDEVADRSRRVRAGKILVSPGASHIPRPVPAGLIHDWIGTAFFPNAKLEDVMAVVRDYDHYQDFYKPSVAESKSLPALGEDDRFSMLLVNQEVVAHTALDSEYQACYQEVDAKRWYGIATSTRVQEIRDYGHRGEKKLPPDEGSGYVWRLHSIARFEERDGGVYVELEAMALSRDIPVEVRWAVDPIVRRLSRSALSTSLRQMREAVYSKAGKANNPAASSCAYPAK